MRLSDILATGGAILALVGGGAALVCLWAHVIDMAKRFGLREAVPGFAIAAAVTGMALMFSAVLIQEAPRAFGAL